MAITSKGIGKSAGSRVIACVKVVGKDVFLLTIYDKSEKESISAGAEGCSPADFGSAGEYYLEEKLLNR
jgi:hypothetical protein